jgi:hypothetical protein
LGWAEPGASALFEPLKRIEPPPIRTCLATWRATLSTKLSSIAVFRSAPSISAHRFAPAGNCAVRHSAEFFSGPPPNGPAAFTESP